MSRSARLLAVATLVGASTLTACSADPSPTVTAPAAPTLAPSYSYTLASSCGERAMYGTFSLTVDEGAVAAVEGLDTVGIREAAGLPLETFPTIETLTARAASDDPAEASYDPDTGMLTKVVFDPVPQGVDDEECYVISDYTPAP